MSAIEDAIVDAVRLASGIEDLDVRINDRSSRWYEDRANVSIQATAIRRIGSDESRRRAEGSEYREVIHGVRVLRLQVRVDGVSHVIGETSGDLADSIIAGLEREDVRQILSGANLSRARCGTVSIVGAPGDNGDTRSLAIFDLEFNASREIVGSVLGHVETAPATSVLE